MEIKQKKYIEKVFQDDADNMRKLIVEKLDADHYAVRYFDVKNEAEITVAGGGLYLCSLFEIINRAITKLTKEEPK